MPNPNEPLREKFLCDDGLEHRIGQNARDSGHGARPVGPQICLKCRKPLLQLIADDKRALLERVEKEVIGEDDEPAVHVMTSSTGVDYEEDLNAPYNTLRNEQRVALNSLKEEVKEL